MIWSIVIVSINCTMLLPLLTYQLAMERLGRSQVVKGVFLLVLVFFIPFVSSSLRSSYLYVLLNVLIVVVGAESGLLEAIVKPREVREDYDMTSKAEKAVVKKTFMAAPRAQALRRCPSSRPSIFFIGGSFEGGTESSGRAGRREEEEISKQELFTKAEAFIGNFYMQLEMQREESWKRIHELYQKAF